MTSFLKTVQYRLTLSPTNSSALSSLKFVTQIKLEPMERERELNGGRETGKGRERMCACEEAGVEMEGGRGSLHTHFLHAHHSHKFNRKGASQCTARLA